MNICSKCGHDVKFGICNPDFCECACLIHKKVKNVNELNVQAWANRHHITVQQESDGK